MLSTFTKDERGRPRASQVYLESESLTPLVGAMILVFGFFVVIPNGAEGAVRNLH